MINMTSDAVTARLREAGAASDLRTDRRLAAKIDMSAAAVTRRLRIQSELRRSGLRWAEIGRRNGLGGRGTGDRPGAR